MRKVPGAVSEAFELATGLMDQEAFADIGQLAEPVSMKNAPPTAQNEAKLAQDQLIQLQQKSRHVGG